MIDAETVVVLEPSAILHIAFGDSLGTHLVSEYRLTTRQPRPAISITTVGEILRVAQRKNYGAGEVSAIRRLLHSYHVVDVLSPIVEEFARIGAALDVAGEPRPSPHVWVGAMCSAIGKGARQSALLACHPDFKVFSKHGVQVEYVDPSPYQ